MADRKSSPELASLAARVLRRPSSATTEEIKDLAACVLGQARQASERGTSAPSRKRRKGGTLSCGN